MPDPNGRRPGGRRIRVVDPVRLVASLLTLAVVVGTVVRTVAHLEGDDGSGGSRGAVTIAELPSPSAASSMRSSRPTTRSSHEAAPRPTPATTSGRISSHAAQDALADAVRDAWRERSGNVSVGVVDLATGTTASYDPVDHRYATASIVKVDILCTLLMQVEKRGDWLSAAQRGLATRMIEHSDNAAASALWRQIGGAAALDRANATLGLGDTKGGLVGGWGLTTTTASDQLRLLRAIFTDASPLSPRARGYLQELMRDVESDQDWGVTAADPDGEEKDAVKNGWLPRKGTGLWVVNSIGSVSYQGHPLLIAVVSDNRPSMGSGIDAIEDVAEAAAEAVTGI